AHRPAQRRPRPRTARGRPELDRPAAAVADGRPARGHAADGTGRRADARPPGGTGAALRPGRAERRLRQRPGLADAAARDGLGPPDGRAAHEYYTAYFQMV